VARDRLETILRQSRPAAFCLSMRLEIPDLQLRDAAQLLVVYPDFRFQRRTCHVCERPDEVTWFLRRRTEQSRPVIDT